MRITREEILKLNSSLGGNLVNSNSLDYSISRFNHEDNRFKTCAFIIRGIVVDHPFSDGNKRTAVYVCMHELGDCGDEKLSKFIVKIAKENISNINKIEKMLRRCYQKN